MLCENPLIFKEFLVEDRIKMDTKREIRGVNRSGSKMMSVVLLKEVILRMSKTDQCAGCQKVFLLSR